MHSALHQFAIDCGAAWHDRWLDWRDRWLTSPAFRRRAAAFALTRPTARRHAAELFDLVAGFVYSQVLLACVQLRLFDVLAKGPQTVDALARRFDMPKDSMQRLLDAAVSLQLVAHRRQSRYGLGRLGAPMVGNTAVAAMVQHHAALYADLADPVALLKAPPTARGGSALSRYWAYGDARPGADPAARERVATYSRLMAASQPLVADEILDAYDLRTHRCLLDVGGGDGTFLTRVAARSPSLRLMLFELPAVADQARARVSTAGMAHRIDIFVGSFFEGGLPAGADIASLVRVIHDHDDEAAMRILRAVHDALPDQGTLLLAEPMAGTPGAEAMGDAYFGFYLLAMGRGRPRTPQALAAMLSAAGFVATDRLATRLPLQTQLLVARRGTSHPCRSM